MRVGSRKNMEWTWIFVFFHLFFPCFFHTFFQFMAIEASRGPEDANEQVLLVGMRWQHILAYYSCRGVGEEAALSSFFCLLHVYFKFSSITKCLAHRSVANKQVEASLAVSFSEAGKSLHKRTRKVLKILVERFRLWPGSHIHISHIVYTNSEHTMTCRSCKSLICFSQTPPAPIHWTHTPPGYNWNRRIRG